MKTNPLRIVFPAIFWVSILFPLCAQLQSGVEWLTTKDGLSQGYISAMLQDREGFLWIGTKNGLNRYDGRRFEVFTSDPYNEFTLSRDHVTALAEYEDFLVVGVEWGGLNLFHKKTRNVYRLHCELPDSAGALEQCLINWTEMDAAGNIWLHDATTHKLYRLRIPPEFWKNPPSDNAWQKKIAVEGLSHILWPNPAMSPDKKRLFGMNAEGVFEVDVETDAWTALGPAVSPGKKSDGIHFLFGPQGNFWIACRFMSPLVPSGLDLYRYRPAPGGGPAQFLPMALDQPSGHFQHVSQHFAWIQLGGEIRGYQLREDGDFDFDRPEISGIRIPEGFSCSMTDGSGIVWIGTNGLGIVKFNPRANRFRHLFPGVSIYSPVLQDPNGHVLAYSNTWNFFHQSGPTPAGPNWPVQVFAAAPEGRMATDGRGACWLAGRDGPTQKWVLKKMSAGGDLRTYTIPYEGVDPIALRLDEQGLPWLGVAGDLLRFDAATGQLVVFNNPAYQEVPLQNSVFSLARTADGSWWLATARGLIRAKPAAGSGPRVEKFDFEWLKNDPSNRNSLRNNSVATLLTDPNDPYILWIGTKGGGLDRLDVRSLQFSNRSTYNGLPDNVIYGVLAEDRPTGAETVLWMSSNKGIIRYAPGAGEIKNYTEEDGVQANEFNTWAYGKGPTGDLLFGGVNGLTVFHPRELLPDTLAPRIFITRLRLNDRDVSWHDSTGALRQGVEFTREITVPFSRNSLTLEFVALHFASPDKNRFRYYLAGAEAEWAHESADPRASYLNLAPGTYTFRVIGSNSEGVWSRQPAELKITILPPWYRTWLAWIAYVLLLGGGAYGFYRYQLRTRLEHAENLRLKEMDSFKSRFFTNVTHEFRTPLTVILGMTERLEKNGRDEKERSSALQLIRRNGQNLLRLISEILDLAKLESNTLKMNYVQGDVLPYLRYISESLHSLANAKNVLMRVESPQARIEMDYDPERLLQIVHNLLSNAVKFTPGGGKVTLRAEERDKRLHIEVADTGVGIPPEDLPHVFERFYQAKNQEHNKAGGTGVGLSLTRELVRALGGDISATSEAGKGATFSVRLPITRKARPAGADFAAPAVAGEALPAPTPRPTTRQPGEETPQLLIIEDNPDVVEYLSACLQGLYELDFAYNGRAGIEKAIETVPDVIISDVMMPEKDGFEVCETLKNDERTSHIPIVLLTARATMEDRIAGLRRGADAYLAKPFNPEELLVKLNNLTQLRARLQARYAGGQPLVPTEDKGLEIEDAFLQKIRAVVEANLSDSDFEMPQLERKMAMSRSQIFRKMKALTDQSPSQFIRGIRLAKAKELLASSKLTVSEIAYETGFSSLQYFSDVFFEEFGQRPSATRN